MDNELLLKENEIIKGKMRDIHLKVWDKAAGYSDESRISTEYDGQELTLFQSENPDVVLYESAFWLNVERDAKCFVFVNGDWKQADLFDEYSKNKWRILFDFSAPVEKIKIAFDAEWIDDYEISVKYVYSDREAYEKKVAEEKRQELLKKSRLAYDTEGKNTNIYFTPATETFKYAVIDLLRKPDSNKNEVFFLKSYRLPDGECIWMDNLLINSNVEYVFVLKQYDKDGNLIVESDPFPRRY